MRLPFRPTRLALFIVAIALFAFGTAATAHAASVTSASAPVVTPHVSEASQSGLALSLKGTGFSGVIGVNFGAKPAATFHVNSNTQIIAVAPKGLSVGDHKIFLVTAAGSTDTGYPFVVSPPAPMITSLSRTSGSVAGGDTVVVKGQNLSLVTMVTISGLVKNYDLVSSTEIDIITAPHAAGPATLSINTLGGTAQTPFTFTNTPAGPTTSIASITPDHGFIGGNTKVELYGSSLGLTTSVKFSGIPARSFTVISDTQVEAISPNVPTGGLGTITLSTGTATTSTSWTYLYVAPGISSVTPDHEASNSGATTLVTVNGWGFTGTTKVQIAGHDMPIKSLSDKQIVIELPSHSAGQWPIQVFNPAGASNTVSYSYN